jgi:hypothetical protein
MWQLLHRPGYQSGVQANAKNGKVDPRIHAPVCGGMTGRKTEFAQTIADTICDKLADGKSMRTICLADDMPAPSTVFKWLKQQPDFAEQYARAREAQADTLADEILDIADDGANDFMEDGKYDGDAVARSKLRVDARKWVAAKLKPRVYGDKTLLGSDPDNPLPSGVNVSFVGPD